MPISIIRKADIVARVPDRWARRYSTGYASIEQQAITEKLKALPPGFTADEVNSIIGNNSWTRNECTECSIGRDVLVRVGDVLDYEARWVDLCEECLRKADAVLTGALRDLA